VSGGGSERDSFAAAPATWRSLFTVREFRALWLAYAASLIGDQLARVAIAVLVYDQTGSALITGSVYAISYVPWLIGGPLLGGLADRYPRRTMMVTCHLGSAVLVAVMAIPQIPLPVLCVLLFLVILLESPFQSARAALIVDVLPDDRYVLASAVTNLTIQGTQVLGFLLGGAAVTLIGSHPALALDSGSYLFSAAVLLLAVRSRPAPHGAHLQGMSSWRQRMKAGAAVVFGDRRIRSLVMLAWLAAFWVVPEGLAAPYARQFSDSAAVVGLLLAAQPFGAVFGGLVLSRLVRPVRRLELMGPLAVLSCVPLILCALAPPLALTVALLVVSGIGTSYNLPANAAFMQTIPDASRGQAFGLVSAGLVAFQGLSMAAAGAVADVISPPFVVAGAGILGTIAALTFTGVGRKFVATAPARWPEPSPLRR
jgi:MFS family permease